MSVESRQVNASLSQTSSQSSVCVCLSERALKRTKDMGAEAEARARDAEREQQRDVPVECVMCVGDGVSGSAAAAGARQDEGMRVTAGRRLDARRRRLGLRGRRRRRAEGKAVHEAEGTNGDKAMVGDENVSMQYACTRRGHVEEEAQPGHKRMTWRMSSASSGSSRRWRSDDIWRRAADETSGRRSEQRDCEGTDFCVGNDYGRGSLFLTSREEWRRTSKLSQCSWCVVSMSMYLTPRRSLLKIPPPHLRGSHRLVCSLFSYTPLSHTLFPRWSFIG